MPLPLSGGAAARLRHWMTHMNAKSDLLRRCSVWYEQLSGSPQLEFADLNILREKLAEDGAYVIWLRLKEETSRRCLKIGKAQRAGGLYSRLYEHWGSRRPPNPNVLAQHLISDSELARRTGLDLKNRVERRRLLEDWCTFQAQPFGPPIAPGRLPSLNAS